MRLTAVLFLLISFRAIMSGASPDVFDLESARKYCDSHPLDAVEGIWEFTDDGVTVLIFRVDSRKENVSSDYRIMVLHSGDGTAFPGEEAGSLKSTAESRKFEMRLSTHRHKGILGKMRKCAATLGKTGDTLEVQMPATFLSFHPAAILPRFWRLIRIHTTDPAAALPRGLVKIYPSYDGNGSSRFHPRYL